MGTAFSTMLLSTSLQRLQPPPGKPQLTQRAPSVSFVETPQMSTSHPVTDAYPAEGYFTGVRSSVVIPRAPADVFDSLSKDLQHIFGPIAECRDERREVGAGWERLQRRVRIPFAISYFTGNIHLKMDVENNRQLGQIQFESVGGGKFLSKLKASFLMKPARGPDGKLGTAVQLDSRIIVRRLPPPPLKRLVKGVVVRKMDCCMRDLAAFHAAQLADQAAVGPRLLNNIQPTAALMRWLNTERREDRHSLL